MCDCWTERSTHQEEVRVWWNFVCKYERSKHTNDENLVFNKLIVHQNWACSRYISNDSRSDVEFNFQSLHTNLLPSLPQSFAIPMKVQGGTPFPSTGFFTSPSSLLFKTSVAFKSILRMSIYVLSKEHIAEFERGRFHRTERRWLGKSKNRSTSWS